MSFLKPPVLAVSGVAINADQNILLIQRKNEPAKGLWTFPGGKVEPGETLAAALTREFKEETNLDIDAATLMTTSEAISPQHHFVILVYKIGSTRGSLSAGDDAQDAQWIALDELKILPTTESVPKVLVDAGLLEQ